MIFAWLLNFCYKILFHSYSNIPYLLRLIAFDQLLILKNWEVLLPIELLFQLWLPNQTKTKWKELWFVFMNDERKLWHLNFERNWPHIWQHPSFISEKNSMSYWYWFDRLIFWQWRLSSFACLEELWQYTSWNLRLL